MFNYVFAIHICCMDITALRPCLRVVNVALRDMEAKHTRTKIRPILYNSFVYSVKYKTLV